MRQVVLDTETTGISHQMGHRIIEIGCIELINRQLTNRHFHVYLNPDREVDEGAFRVHGISTAFLKDKPRFKDVVDEFLEFIKDSELIIHNAPFDVGFIDAELSRLKSPYSLKAQATVFDTLVYAREKHRGARNNLDALCKRYHVDNSGRQYHGALLDADILASVYLAMTGGQIELFAEAVAPVVDAAQTVVLNQHERLKSTSPVVYASEEELLAHQAFVEGVLAGR
ncbi:MAG: DNA polymerase III subunit epsilon [Gammaproteobacteria bacterium]|nr:DNA polymerase III subunit epsilon [Gammaproteobacteria bacterium]